MSFIQSRIRKAFVAMSVTSGFLLGCAGVANSAETVAQTEFQKQVVTFPNGITAHPDVVYSVEKGFRPLRLDIYNTPDKSTPKPVILFVHGGAWENGNKRSQGKLGDFPAILADLAKRGYVVASAEYRLNGEASFPAPYHDIQAAIRFLRSNAADYGINPEKFGVWGSSSGGQLAALAAVTCGNDTLERVTDQKDTVSACVNAAAIWNGVLDLKAMEPAPKPSQNGHPRSRLLNCNPGYCTNYVLEAASAYNYINANSPPFFLAHSRSDEVVPVAQSEAFEQKLRENGVDVSAFYVDGFQHGFVGNAAQDTAEISSQLLKKTFDFFDKTLLK